VFGQHAVDRQLHGAFPGINAPFASNDVLYAGRHGRLAAISVGRKQPGMHDVRLPVLHQPPQPPVSARIDLPALADDRDRDVRAAELLFERSGVGEHGDVDVEPVARQPRGQQGELLLRAAADESRNDEEQANRHGANRRVRVETGCQSDRWVSKCVGYVPQLSE
jgi:hypothetical protein